MAEAMVTQWMSGVVLMEHFKGWCKTLSLNPSCKGKMTSIKKKKKKKKKRRKFGNNEWTRASQGRCGWWNMKDVSVLKWTNRLMMMMNNCQICTHNTFSNALSTHWPIEL